MRPAGPPRGSNRFPVTVLTEPSTARLIATRIQADIGQRRQFSLFELPIGDRQYQVVARIAYRDKLRLEFAGVFGFMVNIPWVRQHYFPELTREVARINPSDSGLVLGFIDECGDRVASTPPTLHADYSTRRPFPVHVS